MFRKIKNKFLWLRTSSVAQTLIGFFSFLIIAAVIMLFLEAPEKGSGIRNLFSSLWFSIVTVTTVGYGDLSPVSIPGKVAAVAIMLIGILYIGILTGNITSWLVERNRRRVFGLVRLKKKEGHFLIFGWRQGMADLLKDILRMHNREAEYLVLVNSAESKEVSKLKQDRELEDLSFLSGDHGSKEVLQNACGHTASKVLILSEEVPGMTMDEIDFKSVLATIAIKQLNPEIYAIVEIMQPKFGLYLRHIEVEEIILNRFSSRALLSNIALMSGLNNVFTSFFSMNGGRLKITSIDRGCVGKTYAQLKRYYDGYLILGIIENNGNLRAIKKELMATVETSISIASAIQALNKLKTLKSNEPIFHPPPHFLIKKNSGMIVLKAKNGSFYASEESQEPMIENHESHESLLRSRIETSLEKETTWQQLVERLEQMKIEFYQYDNKINGVIYRNRKYPFPALNISDGNVTQISNLHDKKGDQKAFVKAKLEAFLFHSSDWEEFSARLQREGMTFYLYRSKINGIKLAGKTFSFKMLGLEQEAIDAIRKAKGKTTVSSGGDKKRLLKREPQNLVSLISERKKSEWIQDSDKVPRYLVICGWKPQLPEMLNFVISQYPKHHADWNRISIVANIDATVFKAFNSRFGDHASIKLHQGSMVDRELLIKAGIEQATKVIILAETESGKSFEEIDLQTVLTAMMIVSLNKKAYKVAEILDKRYKESLEQAKVEEIYLEDEFSRIMLANGSHGVGITKVIGGLVNLGTTLLRTKWIDQKFVNRKFILLAKAESKPGELIIGLLEETGNIDVRKSERIQQAQIQSNIRGQVEELVKVKDLQPNKVVIAPEYDYLIPPNSQLISLTSSDPEGWKQHQTLEI